MLLHKVYKLKEESNPLQLSDIPVPTPCNNEVLIEITACGVCHTELDEVEGRTPPPEYPVVPGHQVIGRIVKSGKRAHKFKTGDRVGVAWIFSACGRCKFCRAGYENLCDDFKATGRDANGGYAEYMTAPEKYTYAIPEVFSDVEAAPLLCAGAIGYRSLKLSGLKSGQSLGLMGFGASAHLVLQMAKYQYPGIKIFVFARNEKERGFARELGAEWTGDIAEHSPEKLECIIDTTPVWRPLVEALAHLEKGGRLVINAIRKKGEDKDYLQRLSYHDHLWLEREVKSVGNITGNDVREFLELAAKIPLKPEVEEYALEDANAALLALRLQKIRGAKVLRVSQNELMENS